MVRKTHKNQKKTGRFWIFCEGKTEKRYFENLRVTERPRMKIVSKESKWTRADQILNEALKFMKSGCINGDSFDKDRDSIACIFDRDDNNTKEVFNSIRRRCGDVILGYSNPAFEYWILCHDGFYDSKSYDQKDVYALVKDKFGIDTKKEKELYKKTKDKILNAKKHAKRIRKVHDKKGVKLVSRDSTPLSLIYEIIELIDQFKD